MTVDILPTPEENTNQDSIPDESPEACEECGDTYEVIDGLCGICDNRTWCTICQEYLSEEEALFNHRHVFSNDDCEWLGPGGTDMNERREEEIKQSLFAVLDKTGIAMPLRHTVQAGRMGFEAIHYCGSTFGYSSIWCWLYDAEGNSHCCGDRFTQDLTDEQNEAMTYGVGWLIGLDEETTKANELTVKWIDEYLTGANNL